VPTLVLHAVTTSCQDIDPAYELYLGRTDDALRLLEVGLENGYLFAGRYILGMFARARSIKAQLLRQLAQENSRLAAVHSWSLYDGSCARQRYGFR
jgi:hypothetical protein